MQTFHGQNTRTNGKTGIIIGVSLAGWAIFDNQLMKPFLSLAGELVLVVSRERSRQHDTQQDIKRPPVRGGVGPSGSASPFFVAI